LELISSEISVMITIEEGEASDQSEEIGREWKRVEESRREWKRVEESGREEKRVEQQTETNEMRAIRAISVKK